VERAGKKIKNGCGGTSNLTERSEIVSRPKGANNFIVILITFKKAIAFSYICFGDFIEKICFSFSLYFKKIVLSFQIIFKKDLFCF